jgi:hypothetical protein
VVKEAAMRKRLLRVMDVAATGAGRAVRHADGIAGAALAVVGVVQLTGESGWGYVAAAAFLLIRSETK